MIYEYCLIVLIVLKNMVVVCFVAWCLHACLFLKYFVNSLDDFIATISQLLKGKIYFCGEIDG